ncbi:MAG: hydroxymethylglutaryl-CoA reductase, degradative [Candidatus Methanomethyliaceae archaeon]|nr:hydroxymethylglutaryl-CoA reductase, degradative [Candidatus Methanomethyliaceae archaeon]MDW7970861.1 hydroxymethylglutaryl-CoA reductase, degradative [Nitrososphaerota archaeon]
MRTSRLPGFYKMSINERRRELKNFANLTDEDLKLLDGGLEISLADKMVENVVGIFPIPLGIAVNFRINGKDYLIPMVIEEPSVIAAASHAAKLALPEGFIAECTRSIMRGQIQVLNVPNPNKAINDILKFKSELIERANSFAKSLVEVGGGVRDVNARIIGPSNDEMLIVEFFVDCKDAMGANTVNTIVEGMAPDIEAITGGSVLLRIISNLATERIVRAKVVYKKEVIGEKIIDDIIKAYKFACYDVYRATTHNKGIMNGIIAIALATANDTRAIEAGAHAYASLSGRYLPLSRWYKNEKDDLVGELEMPLAVGTVGGAIGAHPLARLSLKILGIKTAKELAEIMCAVGLAQNFAALRALVTEGIQRGHMELHARNIAIMVGAKGDLVDKIAEIMVRERDITPKRAKEILDLIKSSS